MTKIIQIKHWFGCIVLISNMKLTNEEKLTKFYIASLVFKTWISEEQHFSAAFFFKCIIVIQYYPKLDKNRLGNMNKSLKMVCLWLRSLLPTAIIFNQFEFCFCNCFDLTKDLFQNVMTKLEEKSGLRPHTGPEDIRQWTVQHHDTFKEERHPKNISAEFN